MSRPRITQEQKESAISGAIKSLNRRIKEKGDLSFLSIHEIKGVVSEEYEELCDEVRDNNHEEIEKELNDIIVAALWSIASIKSGNLDW